jgi:hypothetical protein
MCENCQKTPPGYGGGSVLQAAEDRWAGVAGTNSLNQPDPSAAQHLVNGIGRFPGVQQIAATPAVHELLSQGAETRAPVQQVYKGGHLIDQGRAKVYNVYLGSPQTDPTSFDEFCKAVVEQGGYHSPDGKDTTNGHFMGSMIVPTYPWPMSGVDDSVIEPWVDSFMSQHGIQQDGYTLLSLIFPVGSVVTMGGQASCKAFCGFHSATRIGNFYSVLNDTSCQGCNTGKPLGGLQMVWFHEHGEWRADPVPGTGWVGTNGMENADMCAWQPQAFGPPEKGWLIQPLAINAVGTQPASCWVAKYQGGTPPPPPPVPGPALTISDLRFQVMPDGRPYVTIYDPTTKRTWGGYLS